MEGYEIDVSKYIAREIRDREMSTHTIMVYSCLWTQIFLDAGVPTLLDIDQFISPYTTIDLGLVRDDADRMSKKGKMGTTIITQAYEAREHDTNVARFTNMGDTPNETYHLILGL